MGVTLPEVLVALLIFSFIAAASVYTLRLGVDARDQLGLADKELRQLQLSRTLMKEDLSQLVFRLVRDEFGERSPFSFSGGDGIIRGRTNSDERLLLAFVRNGWTNPDAVMPRSVLQYVEYLERDDMLIRRIRPYLDDARGADRSERVLFDNLSGVYFEFSRGEVRGEIDWIEEWPGDGTNFDPPPAVAMTIERGGEPLRMLFWTGASPRP